jgi:outer membrane protein OmpA-like peptidoglycan-associated protein
VAKNDFVPGDAPVTLAAEPPGPAPAGTGSAGATIARASHASSTPDRPAAAELTRFRIHFPLGGTVLDDSARDTLDQVAEISKRGARRLLVAGHADASGAPAANQRVSRARAEAVAAYLAGRGVRRELVQIEAHSSEEPVASNASDRSRGQTRRVDVTVLPPG